MTMATYFQYTTAKGNEGGIRLDDVIFWEVQDMGHILLVTTGGTTGIARTCVPEFITAMRAFVQANSEPAK